MFGYGRQRENFVRLEDLDSGTAVNSDKGGMKRHGFTSEGLGNTGFSKNSASKSIRLGMKKKSQGLMTFSKSLRSGVTRAVFPEELKVSREKIFDPQDRFLLFWNKLFVISSIVSVYLDPLFFYLPVFENAEMCLHLDRSLAHFIVTMRCIVDSFYIFRIVLQFRTAYIAPSSRVFGRGELVIDPGEIANRYLHRYFVIDVLSILPLPQIAVWRVLQKSGDADVLATKKALLILILIQWIPRFWRFLPLISDMKKTVGVVTESAWAGAAYYLLWFVLASHVVGSLWYILAVERKDACWEKACSTSNKCKKDYLYCGQPATKEHTEWINESRLLIDKNCSASAMNRAFDYGIYARAISSGVTESEDFVSKYLFCLWFGLQNLSTLGQGLETSTFASEIIFSILVAIFGLILFALLIGNMQTYLQSLTVRLEEMRIKRRDSEQWMHHRVLPQELRERVRRYDQYKWLETRGVDEETIVGSLPKDLRRDIKRHLCLNLVKRVPMFENMDERLLDAVCERLKPSLYTQNTYIVREGDPVNEMLFIIRGRLESVTTDGGRTGFFNRGYLKESDFCGEELLTWALDPKAGANLPSSTRTVRSMTEVESFALPADELKFISSQFRKLHSRQVQHTFRFYSQQWRTWAASFIQAAWRRYARRKFLEIRRNEELNEELNMDEPFGVAEEERALLKSSSKSKFRTTMLASRFAANALRGVQRLRSRGSVSGGELMKVPAKPREPDYTDDDL
ncbi:Cyclic nucleotide-binding domain-containing protein [Heracleum sosnowskyi]|uniref:Cyclic nucleotide-binding domain-containing protein n=1 Tax=Heracleum sosnowskyi TaxID=360622 RepID=A0AAD8MC84_9APIA|nr:Cyclic nucleotide-binding domain-containing protein [Heracleum sosnowskyi]